MEDDVIMEEDEEEEEEEEEDERGEQDEDGEEDEGGEDDEVGEEVEDIEDREEEDGEEQGGKGTKIGEVVKSNREVEDVEEEDGEGKTVGDNELWKEGREEDEKNMEVEENAGKNTDEEEGDGGMDVSFSSSIPDLSEAAMLQHYDDVMELRTVSGRVNESLYDEEISLFFKEDEAWWLDQKKRDEEHSQSQPVQLYGGEGGDGGGRAPLPPPTGQIEDEDLFASTQEEMPKGQSPSSSRSSSRYLLWSSYDSDDSRLTGSWRRTPSPENRCYIIDGQDNIYFIILNLTGAPVCRQRLDQTTMQTTTTTAQMQTMCQARWRALMSRSTTVMPNLTIEHSNL